MIEGSENLPSDIKKYVPNYEYILYDLSPYGDEEIKGKAKLRIFLELVKAMFHHDFEYFIETLERTLITLEELDHQERGIDYFETLIRYIMNARKDLNITDIYKVVKEISVERSQVVMTIAEKLIQEGMEKGRLEGKKEVAKNLFTFGLSTEEIAKAVGLSVEEVRQIRGENIN